MMAEAEGSFVQLFCNQIIDRDLVMKLKIVFKN